MHIVPHLVGSTRLGAVVCILSGAVGGYLRTYWPVFVHDRVPSRGGGRVEEGRAYFVASHATSIARILVKQSLQTRRVLGCRPGADRHVRGCRGGCCCRTGRGGGWSGGEFGVPVKIEFGSVSLPRRLALGREIFLAHGRPVKTSLSTRSDWRRLIEAAFRGGRWVKYEVCSRVLFCGVRFSLSPPSFVPSHDFSGAANLLQKAYYRLLLELGTKPKKVVSARKARWHVQSVLPFRSHNLQHEPGPFRLHHLSFAVAD